MKKSEVRKYIVAALEAASVAGISINSEVKGYSEGKNDVLIESLNMDSLSSMEFCIDLEMTCDVSIAPETLHELNSLKDVEELIVRSCE